MAESAPEIQGIQSTAGTMVQVKHYAVYNPQHAADNAIVDQRTEQEIYLPAFQSAVQVGKADSVMCSYATINGVGACLNTQLKEPGRSPASSRPTGAARTPRSTPRTTAWTRR